MTTETDTAPPAQGHALYGIANLRPERTGLPFVVFISQQGDARHDVRVHVAGSARVRPADMISVTVRPTVRPVAGELPAAQLALLTRWIELNQDALVGYWDGEIEYTEDVIAALRPVA